MKTAGVHVAETPGPVLHIVASEPNADGLRYVTRGWTGLSFAGIVLLGAQRSTVVMTDAEYRDLVASLGSQIPIRQEREWASMQPDPVNHPAHYGGDLPHEPIKCISAWGLNFALGNVVKYIARAGKKGEPIEDLKKARFYLDWEIAQRANAANPNPSPNQEGSANP